MDLKETTAFAAWVRALKPAQAMVEETPIVWQQVLEAVSLEDAKAAALEIARERAWVEPVDVAARVRALRARRLVEARFSEWVPNVDPDDGARWAAELRAIRDRIASGRAVLADKARYEAGLLPPLTPGPAWRSGGVLVSRPVGELVGEAVGSLPTP